ncbi:class I SAM-dependent methyltransferase [Bacillus fungorum]|uniref:class I SAM-dependent methyltransferase n=1 Tax=Bacillus fungorum TaxID=2039284 RepID=UPI00146C675A|nr:class I SAM-dependent methyltransferase [Bacillus fungorum]
MNSKQIEKPVTDYDTNYFDQSYLDAHKKILNDGLEEQIELISSILNSTKETNILDFFCGHGRHAFKLLDKGFNVTGLDINEKYLEIIKTRTNDTIKTIHADGRKYIGKENFDAVLSLENSIGYIENYDDNLAILKSIHSCLKPKGKLIMTLINRDYFIRKFHTLAWFENGEGKYILEKRKFDSKTSVLQIEEKRLTVNGPEQNYKLNMRLFGATELNQMLKIAGFQVIDLFGDFDKNSYHLNSPEMIYICEKI